MKKFLSLIRARRHLLLIASLGVAMLLAWFGLWVRVLPVKPRAVIRSDNQLYITGFSPDSRTLATIVLPYASNSGPIQLWDVQTGCEVLPSLANDVRCFNGSPLFLPDGKHLVFVDDASRDIRVAEVATGLNRATMPAAASHLANFLPSPDGKTIAYSTEEDGKRFIRLWDLKTNRAPLAVDGHLPGAFSPDGSILVVQRSPEENLRSHTGSLDLWDVARGTHVRTLECPEPIYQRPQFSSDGELLVAESDRNVRVWEPATGREVAVLKNSFGPLFLPGQSLLATRPTGPLVEGVLELWDTRTWQRVTVVRGTEGTGYNDAARPLSGDGGRLIVLQESLLLENPDLMRGLGKPSSSPNPDDGTPTLVVRFLKPNGIEVARFTLQNAGDTHHISPDGKSIAFMIHDKGLPKEIHVYDVPPHRRVELYLLLSTLPALLFTGLLWWRMR